MVNCCPCKHYGSICFRNGIHLTHVHEFTYLYFPRIIFFLLPFSLSVLMAKRGFIAFALIKTCDRIELDPVQLGWDNIEFRTVMLDPFECNTSPLVSAINPWVNNPSLRWRDVHLALMLWIHQSSAEVPCWGFPSDVEGTEQNLCGTSREKVLFLLELCSMKSPS